MITFCQMTQNRLSETRYCLEKYLPYVDQAIIVDGGSVDDTTTMNILDQLTIKDVGFLYEIRVINQLDLAHNNITL